MSMTTNLSAIPLRFWQLITFYFSYVRIHTQLVCWTGFLYFIR
jgi:hypothetical protein